MSHNWPVFAALALHDRGGPLVVGTGGFKHKRIRAAWTYMQISGSGHSNQKNDRKDHSPRKRRTFPTLLLLCPYASLLRMNEPCDPDAQNIQRDHGRSIDRHI